MFDLYTPLSPFAFDVRPFLPADLKQVEQSGGTQQAMLLDTWPAVTFGHVEKYGITGDNFVCSCQFASP